MFLLVTSTSVHIPGDERSRTHPGHGYPAHTEKHDDITIFENDQVNKLKEAILRLKTGHSPKPFKLYRAEEIEVEFETVIKGL